MTGPGQPPALIVAGPTAGGKSALAAALARRAGGWVINADSMQVYAGLAVLTAQPGAAEREAAPHALYGVRDPARPGDAAWWRGEALAAMAAARAAGAVPVLCGGSGLYLRALTHGLVAVPPVPEAARAEARALLAGGGPAALHARLAAADPATAARLRPTDSQRLARAWEVWRGTGRGLSDWQAAPAGPAAPWTFAAVLLDPPRPALRAAIAARFAAMLAGGALAEVAALRARGLDPALPAMRAHGVPELSAHLDGRVALADAADAAAAATARYTKRQATWFRHHALASPARSVTISARFTAETQFPESLSGDFLRFLRSGS